MDKSRRIRRILKWAGVGLCLALLLASLVSMRWQIYYQWENKAGVFRAFALQKASLGIIKRAPAANRTVRPGWGASEAIGSTYRTPTLSNWPGLGYLVRVPLWIPFLLLAVPTFWLIVCDRRRIPPGHCRKCGYNLTGNVSGVCPECGRICEERANLQ